ncbi:MAG: hypothetical protein V2J51_02570 [Erythrobacter sp.]|jgi:hypothetical protein|nr:hypothetical protein [Erythrobacter sp.]
MSTGKSEGQTREERLAAKLRENLRRRKAQGRAMTQDEAARGDVEPGAWGSPDNTLSKPEGDG